MVARAEAGTADGAGAQVRVASAAERRWAWSPPGACPWEVVPWEAAQRAVVQRGAREVGRPAEEAVAGFAEAVADVVQATS